MPEEEENWLTVLVVCCNSKTFRKSEFNFKNHELTASKSIQSIYQSLVLSAFLDYAIEMMQRGKIILNAAAPFKCVKKCFERNENS